MGESINLNWWSPDFWLPSRVCHTVTSWKFFNHLQPKKISLRFPARWQETCRCWRCFHLREAEWGLEGGGAMGEKNASTFTLVADMVQLIFQVVLKKYPHEYMEKTWSSFLFKSETAKLDKKNFSPVFQPRQQLNTSAEHPPNRSWVTAIWKIWQDKKVRKICDFAWSTIAKKSLWNSSQHALFW